MAAGLRHMCAVLNTGAVRCWGWDAAGQVGDGDDGQASKYAPVAVIGLSGAAVAVVAGQHHTCALLDAGEVRCWGRDFSGQVGDGDDGQANELSPVPVAQWAAD